MNRQHIDALLGILDTFTQPFFVLERSTFQAYFHDRQFAEQSFGFRWQKANRPELIICMVFKCEEYNERHGSEARNTHAADEK